MSRSLPLPGGALEYAVLVALWESAGASAREVYERVAEPNGLVYTTTAKVLERLYAKGLVSRKRKGKGFVYRAKIAREIIDRARMTEGLRRLLGTEPHPAMATLVGAVESMDRRLLDELERLVQARRRLRRGT